tara:strand:+ start:1733 stop:2758 length:1026 start_codon:yes stop_codon:yes gene_type:complete
MSSSIPLLWTQLALTASVILIAATFLAKNADIIAFKTGLGRSFVGVVLLATATSFPELGTGVSSVILIGGSDGADLAAGDAFGSNLFNLLIIGIIDLMWRKGSILANLGSTTKLTGMLSGLIIFIGACAVFLHSNFNFGSNLIVSPVSILLVGFFILALYLIYREQKNSVIEDEDDYSKENMSKAVLIYSISAIIVVIAAIWLAQTGDDLADAMGWGKSFMGTQFLALSTSLPELAASIAAIRIRAPELAVTNLLGSNLFNMGFVLFIDDLAYTSGPLWIQASQVHVITALIALFMTSTVLISMRKTIPVNLGRFLSIESIILISLYIVSSILVFQIGGPH